METRERSERSKGNLMLRRIKTLLEQFRDRAFAPVDNASIVFFRVAFGLLMTWHVWSYFTDHRIGVYWLEPHFLFKFYGFSWVHPWPGNGLYLHRTALGMFAIFIAVGFIYRVSAALFCLSYAYFFLLDETRYQNHQYLICLLSFLLIFIPAHRAFSVDAMVIRKLRAPTAPAWTLWLLRTQMAVVYFYGGVAKINPDWLRGEPMRWVMSQHLEFPILGRFFTQEWLVYVMSYGSLLLDLFIVPLLLWRRTRVVAFCAAVLFHLMNARLFAIDVFPWLAIAATTLFLSPDWPRVFSIFHSDAELSPPAEGTESPSPRNRQIIVALVVAYMAIQFLIPLHPFLFSGGTEWAFMQHRFCWRMMLRKQSVQGYFYVTDPNVDRTNRVAPQDFLSPVQLVRIYWQPDTILQCAHYLASALPRLGSKPLNVEARMFVSVNGRRPELFVDPNVDLAAEARTLTRPRWLLPTHEPLPPPGKDFSQDLYGSPIQSSD
jgi:vitamin K-dependent gamma-carboxylase